MAVHIISKKSIHEYIKSNPKNGLAMEAWIALVESQTWSTPIDIVNSFGEKAVDILGKKDKKAGTVPPERVVLDVKGNHIRVIAKYVFHPKLKTARLYIKWIGSHADYSKLCGKNLQYDIDQFK
jgi:mRNA interferase HigB